MATIKLEKNFKSLIEAHFYLFKMADVYNNLVKYKKDELDAIATVKKNIDETKAFLVSNLENVGMDKAIFRQYVNEVDYFETLEDLEKLSKKLDEIIKFRAENGSSTIKHESIKAVIEADIRFKKINGGNNENASN